MNLPLSSSTGNQPACAPSALNNSHAAAQSPLELPPVIAVGGPFELALANAIHSAAECPARELARRLRNDLELVRTAYCRPGAGRSMAAADQFARALAERTAGRTIDPVLAFCAACKESLKAVANSWVSSATSTYLAERSAYDGALAELIPKGLRNWANKELATIAFKEGTNASAGEDWDVFTERLQSQRHSDKFQLGPTTGLPKLDDALGGLRGLTFVAGDKGVGKTSFVLSMISAILEATTDWAVLLYSLDMPKYDLYKRLLSCAANVDFRDLHINSTSTETRDRLDRANQFLRATVLPRLRVQERPLLLNSGLDFTQVARHTEELIQSTSVTNVLLAFDLYQRIDIPRRPSCSDDDERSADLSETQLDHARLNIFKQIQAWSRTPVCPDGFPILAVSEIRKGDSNRRVLGFDDLLGSARMASDADIILLITPDTSAESTADSVVPLNLRIAKGRDGVERRDIKLWFEHRRTQFYDVDPRTTTTHEGRPGRRPIPRPDGGEGAAK